jgi:hypothetical protein
VRQAHLFSACTCAGKIFNFSGASAAAKRVSLPHKNGE